MTEQATRRTFTEDFNRDSQLIVDEMLAPNGIESWVRAGRTPWIHGAESMEGKFYMIHMPPREATHESYLVMELGGVVCYLNPDDKEGQGCRTVTATFEQGKQIIARAKAEGRKVQLEAMNPVQRLLNIASYSLIQKLGNFSHLE